MIYGMYIWYIYIYGMYGVWYVLYHWDNINYVLNQCNEPVTYLGFFFFLRGGLIRDKSHRQLRFTYYGN